MTETPKIKQISPSAARRKDAKRRAWDCFFTKGNSLTLIAAILIPLIMYMAAQGIYSMIYYAIDPQDMGGWIAEVASVVDFILIFLMLPLVGGTLYIATGLARGEERHVRDLFYAYTSWRAHLRTWIGLLIPLLALSAVAGIVSVILMASQGLAEMASAMEDGKAYVYLFFDGGTLFAVLAAVAGLLPCAYVMPFLWLTFSHPECPLSSLRSRSVASVRGRLGAWLILNISFLGWLALSVASVGVLLVLFAAPYYLLTVSFYIEQQDSSRLISD